MSDLAKQAPKPASSRGKLRMEIYRIDLIQVSSISQKEQTFNASLFVQACLPGANKDATLKKTDAAFPLDMYGRPVSLTFKGNEKYKTPIGASLTVFVVTLLLTYALFNCLKLDRL